MFIHISEKIVNNMEKQNVIQTDHRSIYKYGINQILNMLLNILTFFMIGLISKMLTETVIFTAAYIPMRIYAGGYHASTPKRCWFASGIMLVAFLLFVRYADFDEYVYNVLLLVGIMIILILSPVEDRNKPLDKKEIKIYKARCIIVFALEFALYMLFKYFQVSIVSKCLETVWITMSTMLIIGKIKNSFLKRQEDQSE